MRGQSVTFSLSGSTGGATLVPSRLTDISDENGRVYTTVQSGTSPTTVSVVARHESTQNQTVSGGIIIASGAPVQSKFTFSAVTLSPEDAWNLNGIEVDLSIIASDFAGNDVPNGKTVSFISPESGNVDSECTLFSGECSITWRSGSPRPGDLRATLIAFMDGAEDFTDTNGNGVYDSGDIFTDDLGEPFVDANENGLFDSGEYFEDSNSNGMRDVGNGMWDGPCLSAVDSSADCSGEDSVKIYKTLTIRMPVPEAELKAARITYDRDATSTTVGEGDTIVTGDGDVVELILKIGDSTSVADSVCATPPCGNPLPPGSRIQSSLVASGTGIRLSGADSITVRGDVVNPTVFTLVLSDMEVGVDEETILEVEVTYESETIGFFTWPVVFGP